MSVTVVGDDASGRWARGGVNGDLLAQGCARAAAWRPLPPLAEILADRERQMELSGPVLRGEWVDWERVFDGYVAQIDFPGAAMRGGHPGVPGCARLLSTRPAESWYRSSASTVFQLGDDHGSSRFQPLWDQWLGDGSMIERR